MPQRLVWRAGCIDLLPAQRAEVIALLLPRNFHVRIGRIANARYDTLDAGRKIRRQKQSVERNTA